MPAPACDRLPALQRNCSPHDRPGPGRRDRSQRWVHLVVEPQPLATGGGVPDLCRAVDVARGNEPPIGREHHRPDRVPDAGEAVEPRPPGQRPDVLDRLRSDVAFEPNDLPWRAQVPDRHTLLVRHGQTASVGKKASARACWLNVARTRPSAGSSRLTLPPEAWTARAEPSGANANGVRHGATVFNQPPPRRPECGRRVKKPACPRASRRPAS